MKLAIIGSDLCALLAANAARRAGHFVTVYGERTRLRAPYLVYEGVQMLKFLDHYGVGYSKYRIKSGIMLRGEVQALKRALRQLGKAKGRRVRADLYSKTRLIDAAPGKDALDYESSRSTRAIHFEWEALLSMLSQERINEAPISVIKSDCIEFQDGGTERFDLCLVSAPLWRSAELVEWPLPHACAISLNTAVIDANTDPDVKEMLSGWDYVWTPYTPDRVIHRVFQVDGLYHVQFSGSWAEGEPHPGLIGDLNWLFQAGWAPTGAYRGEAGFLCPLSESPIWPRTVLPIGRLSRWDVKATLSQMLDDLHRVLR